ncbi:Sensor histidine kinase RcsC [subsurface metagenome]
MKNNYGDLLKQIEELKKQVEKLGAEENKKKLDKKNKNGKKPNVSESPDKVQDKRKKSGKSNDYNWTGRKILVVEDNDMNYLVLQNMLKSTQAQLVWAKGGIMAVEICKSSKNINLVLMDIMIPNFDGIEATKKIKELRPDLPVIVQTAYPSRENKERSEKAGCSEFLEKPINRKELFTAISKYIDVD